MLEGGEGWRDKGKGEELRGWVVVEFIDFKYRFVRTFLEDKVSLVPVSPAV